MTPDELRAANIVRFRQLLSGSLDAEHRARLERLIEEEILKPDSAYPQERPGCGGHRPS